jgi:hypothetical protein
VLETISRQRTADLNAYLAGTPESMKNTTLSAPIAWSLRTILTPFSYIQDESDSIRGLPGIGPRSPVSWT